MKRWMLACACLLPLFAYAAGTPKLFAFSPQFKAAVDAAMEQQTAQGRTNALVAAMHDGTDEEVFSVLPLLFPRSILSRATSAGVCTGEIHASLNHVKHFLGTPEPEQRTFIAKRSKKIRGDTDRLIRCIGQFYHDGKLYFPPLNHPSIQDEGPHHSWLGASQLSRPWMAVSK